MFDFFLVILLISALVLLDILAQEFGADSRTFRDPAQTAFF